MRTRGPVIVAAALRPLWSPTTYRRGVHLLLGGVLTVPYVALVALVATAFAPGRPGADVVALVLLALLALLVAVALALIPAVRPLEVVAARSLLGVALPDPDPAAARSWPARWRSAAWYLLNLVLGSAVTVALLVALPVGVALVVLPLAGQPVRFPAGTVLAPAWWQPVAGVAVLVGFGYLVAGAGAVLARVAPAALGATVAEELAASRRRVERLAERNRLARELHDSVGHALAASTLAAAAARQLLRTDPDRAGEALAAIEETSRAAGDDLDRVLGLLRDDEAHDPAQAAPDLGALDGLVDGVRAAGLPVDLCVTARLDGLAAVVSRTAYRIVQEALTNALRHGDRGACGVRVEDVRGARGHRSLRVEVTNPLPATHRSRPGRGGRGLGGVRERVAVLGGEIRAAPDGDAWRVVVTLPVDP